MAEKEVLDEILAHWIKEYQQPQLPEEKIDLRVRIANLTKSIRKESNSDKQKRF
jgi:hypothetical protein